MEVDDRRRDEAAREALRGLRRAEDTLRDTIRICDEVMRSAGYEPGAADGAALPERAERMLAAVARLSRMLDDAVALARERITA